MMHYRYSEFDRYTKDKVLIAHHITALASTLLLVVIFRSQLPQWWKGLGLGLGLNLATLTLLHHSTH